MNFLESIGGLTIIVGGMYFLLRHLDGKKSDERKVNELAQYSDKSKQLISDYQNGVNSGKPLMSHYELQQKIVRILSDPNEEKTARDKILRQKQESEDSIQSMRQKARVDRKVAYKYEEDIFLIFDNNRELSEEEIRKGLEQRLKIESEQSNELFSALIIHRIIDKCAWSEGSYIVYEVGHALRDSFYSIDETDMTHDKWLQLHGKILKKPSVKAEAYQKKYGFNFDDGD